jgi:cytochrome oxidase Cu insertion factor (SCO1/SenC/PrrC family)
MRFVLTALMLVCVKAYGAAPHHQPAQAVPLAPGYGPLDYDLPPAGSYERPRLGPAQDGPVIDAKGQNTSLHQLMDGHITLLSFIYTSCSDVNGCPLASFVLNRVFKRLADDPRLSDKVQLLSLSFDRINDTPTVLSNYAARFEAKNHPNWRFLTTPSDAALREILSDYNQFIIEDTNEQGEKIGSISHLLRVYLIDTDRQIREIYSVSFLHPDILIQDILTIDQQPEQPIENVSNDP